MKNTIKHQRVHDITYFIILILLAVCLIIRIFIPLIKGEGINLSIHGIILMPVVAVAFVFVAVYMGYRGIKKRRNPNFSHEEIIEMTDERGINIYKNASASSFWFIYRIIAAVTFTMAVLEYLTIFYTLFAVLCVITVTYYSFRAYFNKKM
jgi:hypothetical protein